MRQELVSIIVPIYNTELYLNKCIDSLVNQSYSDIEILLINDGSTDSSLNICQKYQQQYANIKLINQINRGVSVARNVGIAEANGKYITFVDSDDELCVDAIEVMYDLMISYNADVVSATMMCKERYERSNQKTEYDYNIIKGSKSLLSALKEVSLPSCAKLFKKESISGIFFEEGRHINEDGYFVFECYARLLTIVDCNKIVYLYTQRPNSASRSAFSEKYLDMLYFMEKKKQYIQDYFPQYQRELLELEIRTNLNFLHILCNAKTKDYRTVEGKCCAFVRRFPSINTKAFLRFEKRLYYSIHLGVYHLYKYAMRELRR